ncbi:thioesterase [Roseibium denhamense]|uniref:Acyl-CoA thioester hydrolase n=1 Tax=Roseibium denhamense TaxID=76305 RepID=A0ABY1P4U6_9HYPH|nr:thioesterase family protein [Roseibium denhamense]MTI07226.1 thioesterase [Roseibium denhamense]SMP26439.1 acyl-CoA thioester hydrolase [Roseibium denhamense]
MTIQNTLHSFVNRWECDENDHLNVQFYFSRFEEADRQFRQVSGLNETLVGTRRVRHVRYHKELRTGDLVSVQSSIAFDGPHMFTVLHEMRNKVSGVLAATALDGYEPSLNSAKVLRQRFNDFQCPMISEANPRGIPAAPAHGKVSRDGLLAKGAEVCFLGTVLPRNIGPDGKADDQFALASCTDGVPHVWQRTPMTHSYLTENGLGRVAVEMKLTWATPLKTGDMIQVVSGFSGVQEKTFSMRHHIFESRTNRLAAVLDVVALTMDLSSRRAVSLPDDAPKAIAAMLI